MRNFTLRALLRLCCLLLLQGATMTTLTAQTNGALACNDSVNLSLADIGPTILSPDLFLEGSYPDLSCFSIEVYQNGVGPNLAADITCALLGANLTYRVVDNCTGNTCWGTLTLEDKSGPVFTNCTTGPIVIDCTESVDDVLPPIAIDNCAAPTVSLVNEEVVSNDLCGNGIFIERTFFATDANGNDGETCIQTIQVLPSTAGLEFPEDITFDCGSVATFPGLLEAAPLNAGIVDADPGTNAIEVSAFTSQNFLANSGAGAVINDPSTCNVTNSFEDEVLTICTGSFKIIRTFTVIDWCSGDVIVEDNDGDDNVQIIKVLDQTGPVVPGLPVVFLSPDVPGTDAATCAATGFIPTPQNILDKCSDFTVQIFTDLGEVDYGNFPSDGSVGGFVPFPGLPIGTHSYTLRATDDCGNMTEAVGIILVEDTTPPTPICDEITQVTLNNEGLAENVPASVFDDGSTDNCCIDRFEVRRTNDPFSVFEEFISFDCLDAAEPVDVTLRVYDCFGNFEDCMVVVNVDDKNGPICVVPPNATIDCNDVEDININDPFQLTDLFGAATVEDECPNTSIEELPATINLDMCGEGIITRRFRPIDSDGTPGPICTQTIFVESVSDWVVNFPPDVNTTCDDLLNIPAATFDEFGCENLALVSTSDEIFVTSDGGDGCYKILRTYTLFNWCRMVVGEEPVQVPNNPNGTTVTELDFGNPGLLAYTQVINVMDNEAPSISYDGPVEFCSNIDDCSVGSMEFMVEIDDNCADDLDIAYQIDLDLDGSNDLFGTGIFDGELPLGTHRIYYQASDYCGNVGLEAIDFTVRDCKKPSPVCMNGVIVELMPTTNSITVTPDLFDAGSFDQCSEFTLSFSQDINDTELTLTCFNLGNTPVTLYAFDAEGNFDFCTTFVTVQDNMNPCDPAAPLVSGQLRTENMEPLAATEVLLSGSTDSDQQTDENGRFSFDQTIAGGDFSITPTNDTNADNGVSTLDLVSINRHILGLDPLDSPYQIIAADANRTESVTALDIVAIRRVILHLDEHFPNNTSWRFVDSDHVFSDPGNPFADSFAELRSYNNLGSDVLDADFVAIKIGDVNGSAQTNLTDTHTATEDRSRETLYVGLSQPAPKLGERTTIAFGSRAFRDIVALQGTIQFDPTAVTVHGLQSGGLIGSDQINAKELNEGVLTFAWHQTDALRLSDNTPLLQLEITLHQDVSLTELFELSGARTAAVAYRKEGGAVRELNLSLTDQKDELSELTLHPNRPNPFRERTTFRFDLPGADRVDFTIFTADGRTLYRQDGDFEKGRNELTVERAQLGDYRGVLYYRAACSYGTAVRSMIVE